MTDHAGIMDPLLVTIEEAKRIQGCGNTELYRQIADGELQAVKAGRRTLIVYESLKARVAKLPPAKIRPQRRQVRG